MIIPLVLLIMPVDGGAPRIVVMPNMDTCLEAKRVYIETIVPADADKHLGGIFDPTDNYMKHIKCVQVGTPK